MLGVASLSCVKERSLFVPEVHDGQRARGALLAVEREGLQTLLGLDLENRSGDPGLIEPYQDGDLTHLFLFTNTPPELFWPVGPIPQAAAQAWPVPAPLLAEYCGRVGDEGLSLVECEPSLRLVPRLPLPDAAGCLEADRCLIGQGAEARCLPCEPSSVNAPTPPFAPEPRTGPCPAGWEARGPLALCRPSWSPVPNCLTRYTPSEGCLPSLPPCPTSTSALGPGDAWRAAIEAGPPGVVRLGPGTYSATEALVLPPGREVVGACGASVLELPLGALVDRPGAARRLAHLTMVPGASVRVEDGQTLGFHDVELRPGPSVFALEVRSATVALLDVQFRSATGGILLRGHDAAVRAEGLSAQGGEGIFELTGASQLSVAQSVVVGASYVIANEGGHTAVSDSHFSGFVEAGVLIRGGSLRLQRSELIGEEQFAVTTSSSTSVLSELYVATRGEGRDPLVLMEGQRGEVRGCELKAGTGEGLVLSGGEFEISDVVLGGGLNGLAATGETLQVNLHRIRIEGSAMAMTVNDGAQVKLNDLQATTRCEGLSAISASHTELSRGELLLTGGGDECDGPILGVNLDRGARLLAEDLRITGAAKALVSRGNEVQSPEFEGERVGLLDNALDLELEAGRVTLRSLSSETCSRWPACAGLVVTPRPGRTAALTVEQFSLHDRSPAFELDGGEINIKDGRLESCPNASTVTGVGLGPVPELILQQVRLEPCGRP